MYLDLNIIEYAIYILLWGIPASVSVKNIDV